MKSNLNMAAIFVEHLKFNIADLSGRLKKREPLPEHFPILSGQKITKPAAKHFLLLIPQFLQPGFIYSQETAILIQRLVADRRAFIQQTELLFFLAEQDLGLLAGSDIQGIFNHPRDFTRSVENRKSMNFHVGRGA